MSMTKRYLESLPEEQQDDILGLPPGEWAESAENEPTEEELAEWARALMEDAWIEEEPDGFTERDEAPLVKPQPVGVKLDGYNV